MAFKLEAYVRKASTLVDEELTPLEVAGSKGSIELHKRNILDINKQVAVCIKDGTKDKKGNLFQRWIACSKPLSADIRKKFKEGVAVLAYRRETLAPIRALCEHHGIPVTWGIDQKRCPALTRLREIACFLDLLKTRRERLPPGLGIAKPFAGNSRKPNQKSLDGAPSRNFLRPGRPRPLMPNFPSPW